MRVEPVLILTELLHASILNTIKHVCRRQYHALKLCQDGAAASFAKALGDYISSVRFMNKNVGSQQKFIGNEDSFPSLLQNAFSARALLDIVFTPVTAEGPISSCCCAVDPKSHLLKSLPTDDDRKQFVQLLTPFDRMHATIDSDAPLTMQAVKRLAVWWYIALSVWEMYFGVSFPPVLLDLATIWMRFQAVVEDLNMTLHTKIGPRIAFAGWGESAHITAKNFNVQPADFSEGNTLASISSATSRMMCRLNVERLLALEDPDRLSALKQTRAVRCATDETQRLQLMLVHSWLPPAFIAAPLAH